MKFLADADPASVIGTINPASGSRTQFENPFQYFGSLLGKGISLFLSFAAIVMLFYLLWGAYDWLVSSGDKEALEKARLKITNAVIGMVLLVAAYAIFSVVTGDILGIVRREGGVWKFNIRRVVAP